MCLAGVWANNSYIAAELPQDKVPRPEHKRVVACKECIVDHLIQKLSFPNSIVYNWEWELPPMISLNGICASLTCCQFVS